MWGCTNKTGVARHAAKGGKNEGKKRTVRVAIYPKPLSASEKEALKNGPMARFS